MLTYLSVSNLAIIEKLELDLSGGLTVVTGETGAGKSMLISALDILLGNKVSKDLVRTGEDGLIVEGIFAGALRPLAELLDGEEPPDEVIIRRGVSFGSAKRDRMHVADQLVTPSRVHDLAPSLVNISSQHEYIGLLRKAEHLSLLDSYSGLGALLAEMGEKHSVHSDLAARVTEHTKRKEWRERRLSELTAQVGELDKAGLRPGEEDELLADIARLTHSVEIVSALQEAILVAYEGESDVFTGMSRISRCLEGIRRFEPEVGPVIDRLAVCSSELEDLTATMRQLVARTEVDPGQLDHLQARLALLQRLKRKYDVQRCDDLVTALGTARDELAALQETETSLDKLIEERDRARAAACACAQRLHKARLAAATGLETALRAMLGQLEMKKARLSTQTTYSEESIGPTGGDDVEFLFSANPGEDCRPLRKIASGGELSRLLLAFKAVLADAYPVPTYVFDEIDSGIGGRTALAVGKMLATLAHSHQVICITHTAQIAAFADHHLVVSKEERGGKTYARVRPLTSQDERVEEIARLLSGLEESRSALDHASELLEAASKTPRGSGIGLPLWGSKTNL